MNCHVILTDKLILDLLRNPQLCDVHVIGQRIKTFVTVPVYFRHVHCKYSINIKYVIFILYVRNPVKISGTSVYQKLHLVYNIVTRDINDEVCKYKTIGLYKKKHGYKH